MTGVVDLLRVGDTVEIDTCEGFGGPGRVVDVRPIPTSHCKVRLDDGSQSDFWAHDFEVSVRPDPSAAYDSRPDTLAHIGAVRENLQAVIKQLERRQELHDLSKLEEPEKSAFDEFTPNLRASTYGSPEYEAVRAGMGAALAHHYANNPHHPEHWAEGIRGMSLIDVVEMLCDWKAATGRHADGDLARSIEINQKRFGYSDELRAMLTSTARALGWLP